MNYISDSLFKKILSTFAKKQELLNRQSEESAKKYWQKHQEKNNINEKAEKDFFRKMEEKKRQIDETSDRFLQKLEKNKVKQDSYIEHDIKHDSEHEAAPEAASEVEIIINQKRKNVERHVAALESLIHQAGFVVVKRDGNSIKIDLREK
ncbi:MAG: hypothetical protein FWC97_11870 [Treponema sp.]|nr:hypothetical protein [Treponema sp.]